LIDRLATPWEKGGMPRKEAKKMFGLFGKKEEKKEETPKKDSRSFFTVQVVENKNNTNPTTLPDLLKGLSMKHIGVDEAPCGGEIELGKDCFDPFSKWPLRCKRCNLQRFALIQSTKERIQLANFLANNQKGEIILETSHDGELYTHVKISISPAN
jgi:hypothetical protein